MTGILQTHARKKDKIAIDLLSFSFKILKATFPSEITTCPEHGVYVYGLFIEGARWNTEEVILEDQEVQLSASAGLRMPIIHFLPKANHIRDKSSYKCPLYKTSVRAGVLNTTGQSTNFILAIDLPTIHPPEFWTLRSTALLTMLDD